MHAYNNISLFTMKQNKKAPQMRGPKIKTIMAISISSYVLGGGGICKVKRGCQHRMLYPSFSAHPHRLILARYGGLHRHILDIARMFRPRL